MERERLMLVFATRFNAETNEIISVLAWNGIQKIDYRETDPEYPKGYVALNQGYCYPEGEEKCGTYTIIRCFSDSSVNRFLFEYIVTKDGIEKKIENILFADYEENNGKS